MATALAVATYQTLGPSPQPAYAMTPPPLKFEKTDESAQQVLEAIAQRVEKLPNDSPSGQTEHFVQESWSLSTRIDGMTVTSAVIPERRETWKEPDGSETWNVTTQKPQFQTESQRKTWEDSGAPGSLPEKNSGSVGPADKSDPRNEQPPSDVMGMQKWLALGYESAGSGEVFDSVSERNLDRIFSPKQRAAILRVLKTQKGIEYRGKVRDRSGRPGEAFSVSTMYGGLPKDQTLIFEPNTGKLLAYEEELTGDAGKLKVRTPAVVLYVTYLKAE
jgi:hypothetical protein